MTHALVRCRSKKIRCDGVRPCCSQCSSVGFECKTSDKLSRRAFPRGYTESLEERVRTLESEVRELKELLDEKDEKIDLLSRLHSQSAIPTFHHSPPRPSASPMAVSPASPAKEETFRVQQAPHLEGQGAASYFTGTSSSKTFLGRSDIYRHVYVKLTRLQTRSSRRSKNQDNQHQIFMRKSCSREVFIFVRETLWPIPSHGEPLRDSNQTK